MPQQHPRCRTTLPALWSARALKLTDSPGHLGGRAPVASPGSRYSRQASLLCLLTGCLAQQHALCVHGGQVAGQGRCHPCSCLTGLPTQQLVSSDDCGCRACEEGAHAGGCTHATWNRAACAEQYTSKLGLHTVRLLMSQSCLPIHHPLLCVHQQMARPEAEDDDLQYQLRNDPSWTVCRPFVCSW